ncbi:hypothetical protein OF83DRAFT_1232040, partial [Amylostereum chailletii]
LWFHDRAAVVASTAFDVHKDWQQFIRIFVALSTASRADLGYNGTVRLLDSPSDQHPVYDFDVYMDPDPLGLRMFRTVKLIADFGADALQGRGTRVWEVWEVYDEGSLREEMFRP